MAKNQNQEILKNYRARLKEAAKTDRIETLTQEFGRLASEMAQIPHGVRGQKTLLLDAKIIYALRRIEELDGIKQQDFIRATLLEGIRKHFATPAVAARPRSRKTA